MFKRRHLVQHISFWGIILLAATAERWMDLVCRVVFQA